MDNIFGIGLPEFVLILVIAGMVMGPERIARTARSLGVLTARLQAVSRSFFRQLNAELDSVDEDGQIKATVDDLNQLRRQVAELRSEVFTLASGAATEGKEAFREIKQDAAFSILPPTLTSKIKSAAPVSDAGTPVYRPPSLFSHAEPPSTIPRDSNGTPGIAEPTRMPRRVEVAEDPDG